METDLPILGHKMHKGVASNLNLYSKEITTREKWQNLKYEGILLVIELTRVHYLQYLIISKCEISPFKAQESLWKRRQQDCKSKSIWKASSEQWVLNPAGPVYI